MPACQDGSRAYRRHRIARGAREIVFAIAGVFGTLVLAPPISMVVIPSGRLVASIPGARVEPTTVLP